MSSVYHAKYFAHELTRRRPAESADRLSMSLFDACVDLNPHQIEAALFALRSPLSKGVVLADEVGLGKTIEAGLVLCQYWAERRRRLLVVCPASLRKQWALELREKFNLPSVILDAPGYRLARRDGNPSPLEVSAVVITSMNFASAMQADVRAVQWDLVVIDEVHKLRNAYRPSNRMGQNIRWATESRRKLLLTATPLQNSLLELYGLSTLIDDQMFGDRTSFQAQYVRQGANLKELRERLSTFCQRTLRNQVLEYIRYTERRPLTQPFRPTDNEHQLYEAVSAFLAREDSFALPVNQKTLTTLILRKLLASSSRAIARTLETMRNRLLDIKKGLDVSEDVATALIAEEDIEDEYLEPEGLDHSIVDGAPVPVDGKTQLDRARLDAEVAELETYIGWANAVGVDTKSRALLTALETGFRELGNMGAQRKAIIFTESRRTQEYLQEFLESNGYAGRTVAFSGTNSGPVATQIYETWLAANRDSGRTTGSRQVDIRTALIEHFRDSADIMIATEAAAEGINLQFCSLVVNYDLPWNPQRIEQRIGRCHRYGQKCDVVVLNFLNERNEADRRVLELLSEKFSLFSGVFGASDDVLGTIESGVDFERRVLDIYQQCRTEQEIDAAFAALRSEMDESITQRMDETRVALLEHFDEDVHSRLKVQLDSARQQMDHVQRLFWTLTRFILRDDATFIPGELAFDFNPDSIVGVRPGRYHLISKRDGSVPGEFLYRLSHPLGEWVIDSGKACETPHSTVAFDVTHHGRRIADVERLKGKAGWLTLQRLTIESFETEEYLLFSGIDDGGKALDQETCEKLFRCDATVGHVAGEPPDRLTKDAERHAAATLARSFEANNAHFLKERDRLERWAEDRVAGAEKDLADTKAQIKALNRQARLTTTTDEQHALQMKVRELERLQRRQRQQIFDVEDEIKEKRDELIDQLERRMKQRSSTETLFTIRWSVI